MDSSPFFVCAYLCFFGGVVERKNLKLCEKGGGILEELWEDNEYNKHFLKNLKLKKKINIRAAKMTDGT